MAVRRSLGLPEGKSVPGSKLCCRRWTSATFDGFLLLVHHLSHHREARFQHHGHELRGRYGDPSHPDRRGTCVVNQDLDLFAVGKPLDGEPTLGVRPGFRYFLGQALLERRRFEAFRPPDVAQYVNSGAGNRFIVGIDDPARQHGLADQHEGAKVERLLVEGLLAGRHLDPPHG